MMSFSVTVRVRVKMLRRVFFSVLLVCVGWCRDALGLVDDRQTGMDAPRSPVSLLYFCTVQYVVCMNGVFSRRGWERAPRIYVSCL